MNHSQATKTNVIPEPRNEVSGISLRINFKQKDSLLRSSVAIGNDVSRSQSTKATVIPEARNELSGISLRINFKQKRFPTALLRRYWE